MKFIGGILDGKEFEVPEGFPTLRVPIRNEKWSILPGNQVLDASFEHQVYVRNGDVYELRGEK